MTNPPDQSDDGPTAQTDQSTAFYQDLTARFVLALVEYRDEILHFRLIAETEGHTLQALTGVGRIARRIAGVAPSLGLVSLGLAAAQLDDLLNTKNFAWHQCDKHVSALCDLLTDLIENNKISSHNAPVTGSCDDTYG